MHPLLGETKQSQFPCPATTKYPLPSDHTGRQQEPATAPVERRCANTPRSVARPAARHTNLSWWSGSLGSLPGTAPA